MKTAVKVISLIAMICWAGLCIGAATGYFQVEPIDYCIVTGLLAFDSLATIIKGE